MILKRILPLVRGFLFIVILLVVIVSVQRVLSIENSRTFEHILGFLQERPNSLDGVFIGSSNVHAFWTPLIGWEQFGIAVWNYSVDAMPMKAIKYYVIEARKTQPDALMIICLNSFRHTSASSSVKQVHFATDYLPLSMNKLRLINELSKGYSLSEKVASFFPIVQFHSRWDKLRSWSFDVSSAGKYKSSEHNSDQFFSQSKEMSGSLVYYDLVESPPDEVVALFSDLLSYCRENQVNVLFVKVPYQLPAEQQGQLNYLENMAAAAGFPCVDLLKSPDVLALDLHMDYYNTGHTNIHGSAKVTQYLGQYLVDHYSFSDKRGLTEWSDWDMAADDYMLSLKPYVFPFELNQSERVGIDAPELNTPVLDNKTVHISWEPVNGAEGYELYQNDGTGWVLTADLPASTHTQSDQLPKSSGHYSYTVVPYRLQGEKKQYGRFDVHGVGITAGRN